ncbi:cupin [Alphaproteobacteria bacterium GH1-50]|uniref:Cupin n=1 Tax=Kangsaoukella pontilimi TaxID=2691042 RepID=A0A7C9IQS2_9RHOB|nr:cupin domain-containing protein [Kangsaoukella pontilimi]MXQ09630.1 cupin [Kangsaoukella pontilimi]
MRVNADFDRRVVVRFADTEWIPSPMPGVERKMLDRIGGEVARATSIVRYAPGSAFSAHTHDGGEEYLVLDGTFCDEHGAFPTGSYVRNPPTSSHTPSAPDGAIILVKLHQMAADDRTQVGIDLTGSDAPRQELHRDKREAVSVARLGTGEVIALDGPGGAEVFVLSGEVTEGGDTLGRWDWLRLPRKAKTTVTAGESGATLWIKTGHLDHVSAPG